MLIKSLRRQRRKKRVRSKIFGTPQKPRLSVFRSNIHIFIQLIDDTKGITLASCSDLKLDKKGTKVETARLVGENMVKKIKDLNLDTIVFDRGGFIYHGRVKALADALRKGGIKF